MKRNDYDVLIAGGGMVGISAALSLHRQLGPECRILLVEGFPLPTADPDFQSGYSPSFDARSTALSYSSCLIFQELQLWDALVQRASVIEQIHVSEQGRFGSTLMQADDYDWPALGYVVENAWLGNVLVQALHRTNIQTLSPARVLTASAEAEQVCVSLENSESVSAQLLLVADGANSALRESLGVDVLQQDYAQHALIANIGHALPHRACAFERFTPQGPLAMLPMLANEADGERSALVWSLPQEQAQTLLHCTEEQFLEALQQRFGYRLGRLQRVGERHAYPLALTAAREQVRSGVVILGNAAHSLHPVAGQGFNLALRDVARLGAVLAEARRQGKPLGDLSVLQLYMQQQTGDQERTTQFSDRLPGLFMQRDPALALLRDIGLMALDLSPALKREFVRHTAGVAASAEYRHVQP
jgi:2-octaprenyl-6-methoxyphenol hydroxylase